MSLKKLKISITKLMLPLLFGIFQIFKINTRVINFLINKNIKKNNIQVIYLLGLEKEILFKHIKNYFTEKCFKSKTFVKDRFSSHEIVDCKN